MNLIMTPLSLGPALWWWEMPTLEQLGWLLGIGCVLTIAHFSMARALSIMETTAIVPLDFTRLPFAVLHRLVRVRRVSRRLDLGRRGLHRRQRRLHRPPRSVPHPAAAPGVIGAVDRRSVRPASFACTDGLLCRRALHSKGDGHEYQRANGDRHRRRVGAWARRRRGALAAAGAKVGILDMNEVLAQKVAAEIGGAAAVCDVVDPTSHEAAVAAGARGAGSRADHGRLRRHRARRQAGRSRRQRKPARKAHPRDPRQPDRHDQLVPPRRRRHGRDGPAGRQRTRLHRHHRLGRCLRRPDRSARLRGIEGRASRR